MKNVPAILCLAAITACATPPRQFVSVSGEVILPDDTSTIPDGFYLYVLEERREGTLFSTTILPVHEIELSTTNEFEYEGYVCPHAMIFSPFGTGVAINTRLKGAPQTIDVQLTDEQITHVLRRANEGILPSMSDAARTRQGFILSNIDPEDIPC